MARGAAQRGVGRFWPGLALAFTIISLVGTGCLRYTRTQRFASSGSCTGACDHYLHCKESDSEAERDQCLEECQQIFVYKGEPDRASLQDFEELSCQAAVAFVDGDAGPKSRSQGRGERRSQTE